MSQGSGVAAGSAGVEGFGSDGAGFGSRLCLRLRVRTGDKDEALWVCGSGRGGRDWRARRERGSSLARDEEGRSSVGGVLG